MQNSNEMKFNCQSCLRVFRSILFLFPLFLSLQSHSQDALRIMPLGNSITFDTYTGDTRPDGDKISYRYQLYQSLTDAGYTFDFVGSERSGWNYLPTTPVDYSDHAGFPGITAADLLTLLKTGRNYEVDPIGGFCELPFCPQNYLEFYKPDVIFLHIGTNGLNTLLDAQAIADDVNAILDLIDAYEASAGKTVTVFLARIINRGGSNPAGNHAPTTYYNQLLDDLVKDRADESIIQVNLETGADIDYRLTIYGGEMIDELHPITSGYDKMAKVWTEAIESHNIASPEVSGIPDQSGPEGSTISFDLDDYVFDPQDPDADMTWTYSGNANFTVSINATTHVVTLTPVNPNWNGSNTITFRATDPGGAYDTDAANFTMTAVNDDPTDITLTGNSVAENQPAGTQVGTLSTADVDPGDTFTYTLVAGTGSGDNASFTISGNRLLTNAVFDYETKSTYNIRIRTTDSGSGTYEEAFTISVTNVNEAPVLANIETSALNYTESSGPVSVTNTITVTDDNTTLQSASISLTSGYQPTEDVLSYSIADGFVKNWDAVTGTFTLQGNYSPAVYQAALRNIKYTNTSADPVTSSRTVTFTVSDGTLGSAPVTRNITIGSVNDAPVLGNIETTALSYTENEAAKDITDNITITDSDDTNMEWATATISSNYQSNQDVLAFTNAGAITGSWNAAGGVLTLTGTSTIANYRAALRNISYRNTSENPSELTRTVAFRVNDGDLTSDPVTRNITVAAVNDAPVLSGIETTPLPYTAGSGEALITGTITVSDTDNVNLSSATVAITGNYLSAQDRLRFTNTSLITGTWSTTTGTMTLSGNASLANYRSALRNVRYENIEAANPNTTARTVQFRVNDGETANNLSNAVTRTITYVPTATISGGGVICGTAKKDTIVLSLTGEPNWTVVIRRTGGSLPKDTTISNITSSPYSFLTNVAGTYVVYNVADQNYADGLEFGSAVITVRPVPTARLTGTSQICQDGSSSAPMSVDFTGTAPWTFVLRRNAQDTTYTGITQDPLNFSVTRQGIYKITSLNDQYCDGDTVAGYGTAVVSYITAPKATLSGVDTVCPGDTAVLHVQFEGDAPFSVTYLRNGANAKTIDGIYQMSYNLKVLGNGTYTLSAVEDEVRNGCVAGTGTVVYYSIPTANISGTGSICEYTTANLRVTLTGTAPWTFSYHRNTEVPTSIADVTSTPRFIPIDQEGTYTLVAVSDKYCNGTIAGSAVVTVTPAPDVSITGLAPAYSVTETKMIPVFGNPAGGLFSPSMLIFVRDTNFFLPGIVGVGLHTLVYSYRDDGTGCYGYDTATVAVLAADAEITFPENDTKKLFCFNDAPFTLLGHNVANNTGSFYISGGTGLVDNHDNTATVYPSQLNDGIYQVTYRYYSNGTFLEVQESFEVEVVPDLRFIGLDDTEYCNNEPRFKLNGNIAAGIFSGKAVTGNISTGFYYEPVLAKPGSDTVFYTYTTSVGCSREIFRPITVRGAAVVDFSVKDNCFSPAITDSAEFINHTTSVDPVKTWEWNFGDAVSGDKNKSGLENPKHRYTTSGYKNVSLKAKTDYCESTDSIWFDFGPKPTADFDWASECFHQGRKVKFINLSSSSIGVDINGNKWKFHHGATYDSLDTWDAEYPYSDTGLYAVELIVYSNYGCTDRITKILALRPTYPLTEGASYFEGFENGRAGWKSDHKDTVNSWELGDPPAFGGAAGDDYAWYTHITDKRPPAEQSYVTSPCFDFTGIKKPMVSLYIRRMFDRYRDGANLQYTADSGKNWLNIGKMNDGINWYNNYEMFDALPGGKSTGWSSSETVFADDDWVDARHSLDEVKGKKNIQFRIAYGSDGTATDNKGIAFDNFQIGERSKIVLVEHFTNASDVVSKIADSELDAIANANPLDVVDIQYHTSFPGPDPFNEVNKVDPGTRVLYYQLSSVPVSVVNGGAYVCDYDGKTLDPVKVKIQALTNPRFNINLTTQKQGNTLGIEVTIIPLIRTTNKQLTLHTAIVERKISGVTGANGDTLFESVLKKIISSTSYTNNWEPGVDVKTFTTSWNLKNTYNTDEIRVVAFIQDEATREIYQAMIDTFDVPLALEKEYAIHRSNNSAGFIAYPNPVNNQLYLRFEEALVKESRIDLFDLNGRLVMTREILPGIRLFELGMGDFPEGLYFLRITSDHQFTGLQKLVISR